VHSKFPLLIVLIKDLHSLYYFFPLFCENLWKFNSPPTLLNSAQNSFQEQEDHDLWCDSCLGKYAKRESIKNISKRLWVKL